MALTCTEKYAVHFTVSFFICLVMASIDPFVRPSENYVRRVWYFLGHVFTWLAPRKWRGKDLVVVECPLRTQETQFKPHSPFNLSCCHMAVSPDGAPGICPHTRFSRFGFQGPPQSCPRFSPQPLPLQNWRGHPLTNVQFFVLFEISFSWRKIRQLFIFKENVMKGKISICFLTLKGLTREQLLFPQISLSSSPVAS